MDYGPFPTPQLNITTTIFSSETISYFGVYIRDDAIIERTEFFTATLYIPTDEEGLIRNIFIEGSNQADVFIEDNDGKIVQGHI